MIGASYALVGPLAFLQGRELAENILEKPTHPLQTVLFELDNREGEEEERAPPLQGYKRTKGHTTLRILLWPASFAAALGPTAVFIHIERFFPAYDAGISPLLVFFIARYYGQKGLEFLDEWYAAKYYTKHPKPKKMREKILKQLKSCKKEVKENPVFVQTLWPLLNKSTQAFGHGLPLDEEQGPSYSALSLLLKKEDGLFVLEEDHELPELGDLKMKLGSLLRDRIAAAVSSANLIPGGLLDAAALHVALELATSNPHVTWGVGGALALFLSTRALIEKNLIEDALEKVTTKRSSWQRRLLDVDAGIFSGFITFLTLTFSDWALNSIGVPPALKYPCLVALGLRSCPVFFSIGSAQFDRAADQWTMRSTANPSKGKKKAQILWAIRQAKKAIQSKLTNSSIETLNQDLRAHDGELM